MHNLVKGFWPKKWPTKSQWIQLPEIMTKKEKLLFSLLVFITLFSFFYSGIAFFFSKTEMVPAPGGVYREGVIQSTKWLTVNPVYINQSEVERDIVEVVFEGLMNCDENGNLVPNLAKSYSTEDGKTFQISLREDIFWSDGEPITADDVIFTIQTILSPDYQSTLRQQWIGVSIEKISPSKIRFILEDVSSVFEENLTLKIIPQHIFEGSSPRDFRYSIYNMKPVGSGPYRFKEIREDAEGNIIRLNLERNPHYFRSTPFLNEVSFLFFQDEEELFRALKRGEIDGFAISESSRRKIPLEDINGFTDYNLLLPRYFSITFNLQNGGASKEIAVRKALNHATNKENILEEVLDGKGEVVNSPLLLSFYGYKESEKHVFDIEKAKEILKEAGFENGKKEVDPFIFSEDLKKDSQGEEVRNLQKCFVYLEEKGEDIYPKKEITGFFDEETKEAVNIFQEKYRSEILDPHNFTNPTGMVAKSTREKLNEVCKEIFNSTITLEITLTTLKDPLLTDTAQVLKKQWEEALGISVKIEEEELSEIRENAIRDRDFEALLFGTMLTGKINPLPLWHSGKTEDPGLNLYGYENKDVDVLLEKIIKERDEEEKEKLLFQAEEKILESIPGIFLYNPYFTFSVLEKIEGIKEEKLINSSKRLENIDKWYINSKRVLK